MEKTIRHTTRQLYVPLSTEDKDDQVKNMLETIKAKAESQLKIGGYQEAIKLQKANIEVYEESIKDSAFKIEHGVLQDVPCKTIFNWEDKNVIVIRKDTYDTVENRDMTPYDKPELTDELYEADKVV